MAIFSNTVVVDCRTVAGTFTVKQTFKGGSDVTSSTSIGTSSTPSTVGTINVGGGIVASGGIISNKVYNAVWNDLADSIPVDDAVILEPGYCYCFDGENYYKSTRYLDEGIIGIHSDTYGMNMGGKQGVKQLDCAVAGFVLAYVDKEYPVGTPLTCTKAGWLTEISKQDKIEYPEKIVATYWKNEPAEKWGPEGSEILVNNRKWVKVR